LLFNLHDDPLEMNGLSASEELLPVQKALFATLLQEQKRTGDKLNVAHPCGTSGTVAPHAAGLLWSALSTKKRSSVEIEEER
jgi:hypothetical protein